MINLDKIVRKNILSLKPYSSARGEFKGEADVFLDANENPFNNPYNRYPDPLQIKLKEKISTIKDIPVENIFLGNGSDEPIDLVIRIFCEPGIDNVVAINPTYGMYQVAANINNVQYIPVNLSDEFELDAQKLLAATNEHTKLIYLCSPNNPTANYLNEDEIKKILTSFDGIVVLDEAYIDFSAHTGFLPSLDKYPNLIIFQTFSKAWGMASIRLGMAFADERIIQLMNKVKYPYNINYLTQQFAFDNIDDIEKKNNWVREILSNRTWLVEQLSNIKVVTRVYPTDANFILVRVEDANKIYEYLVKRKIIVRNRSNIYLCENCFRITVGTMDENIRLIDALKKFPA
jgi:histidinol-phosphate aminotransferase